MSDGENPPTFKDNYSPRYFSTIWVGHFVKINASGNEEVRIGSKKDRPCQGNYPYNISYDKGACVEIIKQSNTRYRVLK